MLLCFFDLCNFLYELHRLPGLLIIIWSAECFFTRSLLISYFWSGGPKVYLILQQCLENWESSPLREDAECLWLCFTHTSCLNPPTLRLTPTLHFQCIPLMANARVFLVKLWLINFFCLSQVSAYGYITEGYQKYSDHYYDKEWKRLIFYVNHDFGLEKRMWKKLHDEQIMKLYQRLWQRESLELWWWAFFTKKQEL